MTNEQIEIFEALAAQEEVRLMEESLIWEYEEEEDGEFLLDLLSYTEEEAEFC